MKKFALVLVLFLFLCGCAGCGCPSPASAEDIVLVSAPQMLPGTETVAHPEGISQIEGAMIVNRIGYLRALYEVEYGRPISIEVFIDCVHAKLEEEIRNKTSGLDVYQQTHLRNDKNKKEIILG